MVDTASRGLGQLKTEVGTLRKSVECSLSVKELSKFTKDELEYIKTKLDADRSINQNKIDTLTSSLKRTEQSSVKLEKET
jgi:hypothetical protein